MPKRKRHVTIDMEYMRWMIRQTGLRKLVWRTHADLRDELPFIPALWLASEEQSHQLRSVTEPLIPELRDLVRGYLFREDIVDFSEQIDYDGEMDVVLFMNSALFGLWKMAAFLAKRAKRMTVHWKDFGDLFYVLEMARTFSLF